MKTALTILMLSSSIFAQHVVTGNVTELATGKPLSEAVVIMCETECGTLTDTTGFFLLSCDLTETGIRDSAKIKASKIGFSCNRKTLLLDRDTLRVDFQLAVGGIIHDFTIQVIDTPDSTSKKEED